MPERCIKSIVECLQDKGIFPDAYAKSEYSSSHKPSIALIYNENNYYLSKYDNTDQWYIIDFKQIISITGYQVQTYSYGRGWMTVWNLSVSFDNKTWRIVDSPPQGFPRDKYFPLEAPVNAKFVKFVGGSPGYDSPTAIGFYYLKFFVFLNPIRLGKSISCVKSPFQTRIASFLFLVYS